ncbi:thiamine biosynthesis lipoprotein [Variovorax boronicumulans]|uniref:FAD:protein FMN transferase n=1 Tax=Variovorax boronicumulans TaxID=436515 RepID=UPI002782C23C|nr:FAD:protein FMN transferase [Variovorax boronicumulans]MDQ0068925.1 thiamine biosynthesis lipoprotein [Variovorax boronicumulans]
MGLSFSTWRAGGYANAAVPRRADPARLQQLGGQTMGTTWSLRFDNPRMLPLEQVREAVDAALARVIAQMSHWEPASDISRFNVAPAGSRHALPEEFAEVMRCALHWARVSGGAIDPTVGPLVACWGFGPDAEGNSFPTPEAIAELRARTGWQQLEFDEARGTLLQPGNVALDLSGIAKGFAVDHGVEALRELALTDLLFEIGGELRGIGRRPDGQPWQVMVDGESPAPQRIALADMAIATSGDRWHRREHEGRRWSHTIDPRNGEPVAHALASVTVLHAECMQADALATVLTVLGPDDGLAFAERHDIAALFIGHGDVGPRATRAWIAQTGA